MKPSSIVRSLLLPACFLCSPLTTAKPLKVFILAGQSNMQGHATFATMPYMKEDPATIALYNRLVDKEGKHFVHENVRVSLTTDYGTKQGALTSGFGATQEKIGPELAFGATMHEKLQEPILIIKTAWGGKNLHTDFRSPSAGPYVFNMHTPGEAIAFKGISNQPYHYLGSAKILSRIGEAFAEALIHTKGTK